jgi:hypothetical protein
VKTKRSGSSITAVIIAAFAVVLLVGLSVGGSRWPVLLEIGAPLSVILLAIALIIWLVGRRSNGGLSERPSGSGGPTNGFAIASLVLSLVGLSVLAIIFGHVSRSQMKRTGESGEGLATAGLILGYVELIASVLGVVYVFVVAGSR